MAEISANSSIAVKAAQAQDKAVEERTNGKRQDLQEYCKTPGICVPARNMFDHESCIDEERAQRKKQGKEAAATREYQIKVERNGSRKTKKEAHTAKLRSRQEQE